MIVSKKEPAELAGSLVCVIVFPLRLIKNGLKEIVPDDGFQQHRGQRGLVNALGPGSPSQARQQQFVHISEASSMVSILRGGNRPPRRR
jgi:hypothetical protein